ncbi:hypothetical protein EYF80_045922 [Liparis tanakae]|uniref:Uncharacterized protein n=1 Tax=Liparis tanakae TaxID=230148 RepID=A0A4Z2FSN9_9TELE|nr:hypothetical protein EYF80_045922 [Liparis tanakae]
MAAFNRSSGSQSVGRDPQWGVEVFQQTAAPRSMGPLGLPCNAFDLGVAAFVPPLDGECPQRSRV